MILYYFVHTIQIGFYTICMILSKGFYFYFVFFFDFLNYMVPSSFFRKKRDKMKERQNDPTSFLSFLLVYLVFIFCLVTFYVDKSNQHYILEDTISNDNSASVEKDQTTTIHSFDSFSNNLYRKYSQYNPNHLSFDELLSVNPEVVSWILVNGTSVNYPVVQTIDNNYYLNHDILGNLKGSGWIFMDYRNSSLLDDSNTIIYGHNLLNQTAFGSLSKLFTEDWFFHENHQIVLYTKDKHYIYEVFSCYYIDPEVYYLQTNFYTDHEYMSFLDTLKSRSIFDYSVSLSSQDKILTLSTCTDDNRGRKVIHAKLVS